MADARRISREALVIVGSLILAAAAIYVCVIDRVLWVLVPIPAAVGLVYHLLNLSSRFESRRSVVEEHRAFCESFDRVRDGIATLRTYGVRGVIDFVSMMEPVVKNTRDRAPAEKTMAEIAGKLGRFGKPREHR